MVLYCLITAFTIGAASLVESRPAYSRRGVTRRQAFNYVCLAGIFLVLAGLAALRIDVGNDYGKYVDTFHEIYAGTDQAYVVTEWGFNFVVRAVYTLCGFENYVLVFALFGAATAFIFLKAMYDQSLDFKASFAMFMLLGLYFRTFTTVRYYFVLSLVMYSLKYVRRKEYIKFLLIILFGALFHKSALIVLPLYFLSNLRWGKLALAAGAVLTAMFIVLRPFILELALTLYPTYRDTVYLSLGVGLLANASGIVRCIAVFLLAAFCYRDTPDDSRGEIIFYLKLNLIGFLMYTCGSFLPLVSRLAYFFVTPQIFLVPALLSQMKRGRKRKLAIAAAAVFCLCYFGYFLAGASGGGIRLLPYQTWIFTKKEWINGSEFF